MWIYGASGHGKVILDCLEISGVKVEGFIDDDLNKYEFEGYPVLGSNQLSLKTSEIIIGIGDNVVRKEIAAKISDFNRVVIHPSAVVSPRCRIMPGTVIFQNSVVQSGTAIGRHSICNTKASIDHDCIIGDFVHIAPGAIICGSVTIGDLTWIGAGATVIQGISVGKNVMIGAGAVVISNIPDNALAVGVPARIIRIKGTTL